MARWRQGVGTPPKDSRVYIAKHKPAPSARLQTQGDGTVPTIIYVTDADVDEGVLTVSVFDAVIVAWAGGSFPGDNIPANARVIITGEVRVTANGTVRVILT